jgi:hypothetical protein
MGSMGATERKATDSEFGREQAEQESKASRTTQARRAPGVTSTPPASESCRFEMLTETLLSHKGPVLESRDRMQQKRSSHQMKFASKLCDVFQGSPRGRAPDRTALHLWVNAAPHSKAKRHERRMSRTGVRCGFGQLSTREESRQRWVRLIPPKRDRLG